MKKLSEKDIRRMSAAEFAREAREPYRRLIAYLKPYKWRFLLGLLCGAICGGLNGLMVYSVKHVTEQVLPAEQRPGRNATTPAEAWYPDRELPELRAALSRAGVALAQQEAAVESYARFRRLLHDAAVETDASRFAGPLAAAEIHPAIPPEFALTLEGERRMVLHPGDRDAAQAEWRNVLNLPEDERRHRTIWAKFLLGQTSDSPEERGRLFSEIHEDLAGGRFTDVLHLAGDAAAPRSLHVIILICAAIPAVMLLRAVFGYINTWCLTWVSLKVLDRIRGDLFSRLLGQSLDFFNRQKAGDLLQTVLNQTRVAQQALTSVAGQIVKEPISIVSALAVLFYIDWRFTLMSFLLFPLCIIPVVIVSRKVRRAGAEEESEAGAMSVIMQEAFSGVRVVKAYGREEYEIDRFNDSNRKMLRSMMRWRQALEGVGPLVEVVASLGVAAALVYVYLRNLPASSFIALNGGLVMLYPPAKALSRIPLMLQKCLSATTKVFELMERPVLVQDSPDARVLKTPARGNIEFQDVSFRYRKDIPAVEGISLTIEAGQTCALVGPSGAGKSTLFSLLLRFYDPAGGRILLDGTDIRTLAQRSLREQIGLVSQDVFLFHDTIYENIRYGRLDATEEEVYEAARRAWAHDFIMAQPNGYQTVVGDKGCMLSGGQQQRISIARAILRNAPILLLDEAMSALDTESERRIQAAIEDLSRGKTVIAIAHRLSTVLNADRIVVMNHGRIEQVGTNEELLRTSPLYRRLHSMQFHTGEPGLATPAL